MQEVKHGSAPFIILEFLKSGPIDHQMVRAMAEKVVGRHNSNVSIGRLLSRGLIKIEVSLTLEGEKLVNRF